MHQALDLGMNVNKAQMLCHAYNDCDHPGSGMEEKGSSSSIESDQLLNLLREQQLGAMTNQPPSTARLITLEKSTLQT
jgi:hypothetical protein